MASTSVELVRSLFAAWERGDYSSLSWADPEIEFSVIDGPLPGTWRGHAGMAAGYRQVMNAWEDYGGSLEGYYELDDGRLLVLIELRGRGKTSGVELGRVAPKAAGVFQVVNGKVTEISLYWGRQRAFADAGLDPNDAGLDA